MPREWWIDFVVDYYWKYGACMDELACRRNAAAGDPSGITQLAAYEQYVINRKISREVL